MDATPFPLYLDLSGKDCLVLADVVAGEAEAKIRSLLAAGARVTVVAEEHAPALRGQSGVFCQSPPWRRQDLAEVWLVVSFLASAEENRRLHEETLARRIFLNVMDQTGFCTAHWPAVIRRDPLVVAVSTGGGAPALAGWIRRRLEGVLPRELGEAVAWMGPLRELARRHLPDLARRGRFWRRVFSEGLMDRFLAGDRAGAEALFTETMARFGREEAP